MKARAKAQRTMMTFALDAQARFDARLAQRTPHP
jgi:hypothetical protein